MAEPSLTEPVEDSSDPATIRPAPDTTLLAASHDYVFEFRAGENARELIIVLSPSRQFILSRYKFTRDVLFLADQRGLYYLVNLPKLVDALLQTIDDGGYETVVLTGSSKGAFGGMSIARMMARRRPDRDFRVLAFSPQVSLHPTNRNLYYPSYRMLRSLAMRRLKFGWYLRRYGDVSLVGGVRNVHTLVVYGARNETDRVEADRLRGPNISTLLVDGATHGTMLYFMMHGKTEKHVRARIAAIYEKRLDRDPDLMASRPLDQEEFARDIIAASDYLPTLDQLLDQAASAPMTPLTIRDRLAHLGRKAARVARLIAWEAGAWPIFLAKLARNRAADEPAD